MTDTHVRDEEARQIRSESGFTLVELLIVIVILGILTAVVVFSVGGLRSSGSVAACRAQEKTVQVALEAYNARMGSYPGFSGAPGNAADATPGTVAVNLTAAQATNLLNHLTNDVAALTTEGAYNAGIKLIKSAPDVSAHVVGTPVAPAAPPGQPAFDGSFITVQYTPPSGTLGTASAQMTAFGWYSDGGVVTGC
ncbi:MAG: prepilin-type N-terminal cleavage/methylation domain-containing protein [Actinobacteria bacterium ATB1]|nr:prepilin-type N-terminal cleavage/methylation domain-containing protein [Actinobacteria bacterium ATB1]